MLKKFLSTYLGTNETALVSNKGKEATRATETNAVNSLDGVPSRALLRTRGKFGRPSVNHSFTQEACGETILHSFLKYGRTYARDRDICALRASHPLVEHLDDMSIKLASFDFTWIREVNGQWATQNAVSLDRSRATLAALLHFDLDIGALIKYLGNNYTGEYHLPNVTAVTCILEKYRIPQHLIR